MTTVVWVVLASLAMAAVVLALVRPPGERRLAEPGPARGVPAWLAPLPDALGVRQRALAAALAAAGVAIWTSGWGWATLVCAALVGGVGFVVLGRFEPSSRARRRQQVVSGLPQACDLLAVAVEAGLPLRVAAERVAEVVGGPVSEAIDGVVARVRLGIPDRQAWAELRTEPGLEVLGRELARVASSGMGVAGLLRELARDARKSAAADAQVRARKSGVSSVLPLMLCFLPAFVLLGIVPIFGGVISTVFP